MDQKSRYQLYYQTRNAIKASSPFSSFLPFNRNRTTA